jgi:hypothetical protein
MSKELSNEEDERNIKAFLDKEFKKKKVTAKSEQTNIKKKKIEAPTPLRQRPPHPSEIK